MHLSREAGWYDVNGNAEYIRKGEQFADDHPAVAAAPQIFDKISDDVPAGRAAKAKAAAAGKSDG